MQRGAAASAGPDEGLAELARLTGLGPKSAAMLAAANIRNVAELRAMGSVAAFHAVKKVDARASLNLLWALEGALTEQSWKLVAKEERTRLLLALDDLVNAERR